MAEYLETMGPDGVPRLRPVTQDGKPIGSRCWTHLEELFDEEKHPIRVHSRNENSWRMIESCEEHYYDAAPQYWLDPAADRVYENAFYYLCHDGTVLTPTRAYAPEDEEELPQGWAELPEFTGSYVSLGEGVFLNSAGQFCFDDPEAPDALWFDEIDRYRDGITLVRCGDCWGALNEAMVPIIPCRMEELTYDPYAVPVRSDAAWGQFTYKDRQSGRCGVMDRDGKEPIRMTQKEMYTLVPQKLREIEEEYGVRVLYAAESGSRAWSTNHENSDYDVRFIYIRPREAYLRLQESRDVLEFPIDDGWDMCGWDITKLLKLLHNSNSQIYEWFRSPVVYVDEGFSDRMEPVLAEYFSTKTAVFHYLHQAHLKMEKLLKDSEPKVKHYLYSLQHLASARWILDRGEPVPLDYSGVTALLPEGIRQQAQDILTRKITRPDQPRMARDPGLDAWLKEEHSRIRQAVVQLPREPEKDWDMLDRFFLSQLED